MNDETFYCPACMYRHKFSSKIGQKHMTQMVRGLGVEESIDAVEEARVHDEVVARAADLVLEMVSAAEPDIQPGEWCACGKPVSTIYHDVGLCVECAKKRQ